MPDFGLDGGCMPHHKGYFSLGGGRGSVKLTFHPACAFRMLLLSSIDDAEKGVVDQERTYPVETVALRFVRPAPSHNTTQLLSSIPAPVKLKKPRPVPRVAPEDPVEIALRVRRLAASHNATQTLASMPAPHITVKLKKPRPLPKVTLQEISIHLPPPRKRMQKRASRRIRFQLWFNTYRLVEDWN
jgi:hypothetical protein